MIKTFSGQVVFYFAISRAISAYVGENWLSQYMTYDGCILLSSSTLLIFVLKTLFLPFLSKRRSITIKDTDGMLNFPI